MKNKPKNKKNMDTKNATPNSSIFINPLIYPTMAQTPNMQTLSFLLQDPALNCWTTEEINQINNLPPLNSFTTGNPPQRFIYDPDESLICYIDSNPIFQTPEYQEILTTEPKYRFPNIDIYLA